MLGKDEHFWALRFWGSIFYNNPGSYLGFWNSLDIQKGDQFLSSVVRRRVCLWWWVIQVKTRIFFTVFPMRHPPWNWNIRLVCSNCTWSFFSLIIFMIGISSSVQLLSVIICMRLLDAVFFDGSEFLWRGRFHLYYNWRVLLQKTRRVLNNNSSK